MSCPEYNPYYVKSPRKPLRSNTLAASTSPVRWERRYRFLSTHALRTPRRLGAPQQPAPHRLLDQRSPKKVTTAPTAPGGDALHRSHPTAAPDAEGLRRRKPLAASGRRADDQAGNVFLRRAVRPEDKRPPQVPGEAPAGGAPAAACRAVAHADRGAAIHASPEVTAPTAPAARRCASRVGCDAFPLGLLRRFLVFIFPRQNKKHSSPHRWSRAPTATSGNGDFQRESDVFCKSVLDRRTCFADKGGSVF